MTTGRRITVDQALMQQRAAEAAQQVARSVGVSPDQSMLRSGVVTNITTSGYEVDVTGVGNYLRVISGVQPAVGDVVYILPNRNDWSIIGTRSTPPVFLGRNDSSGTGTAPTTGATVLTLAVTIPLGLPAGTRIKVEADVFVSTASGIGSSIAMTGCSANPPTRPVNQAASYDGHLVGYDLDPAGGSTTAYALVVTCLTAAQVATWRSPSLRAEILGR